MTCMKITESQNGQIYPEDTFSHGAAHIYNETKKGRRKKLMIKMFLLSLYLLDIVNNSKTSHASRMLDIVGICVNNFNETLFF